MTYQSKPWIDDALNTFAANTLNDYAHNSSSELLSSIYGLAEENRHIHEKACINLNPATNIMNPKAEALLSSGIGSRPSLGYPGDKYEMGLEAIEKIELIAAQLACEVFDARFAEIRVASGAMANLYAFMATCKAGDTILVPPASIGGHVTHHNAGAAGLFGLDIIEMAADPTHYTVDIDAVRQQARTLKPKLITIGGSLNLLPHPVSELRSIADEVGAKVLFDAAHQCGIIAGKSWPNPLTQGAHLMTMSTYKSLGGPPGGLIVSNDADLMKTIDAIAFPGLTANFDAAKSAALAVSLLDWREFGEAYSETMIKTNVALADACQREGLPVFTVEQDGHAIPSTSHQFAIEAAMFGGGQTMAKKLRQANILTCGIGLPIATVDGDMNGLRFGTPEIVRAGFTLEDMPTVATLIADCLFERKPVEDIAQAASDLRSRFSTLKFVQS
ncbi:aminotransferase class I/II-fold pyridoxal phosphate-dependent enzyme [Enterovibrio sp. ZSDZ35]|uniref:Aminotransferase class I/II-fold pyridoxal phosphate-dependent enzyme n=1 Tax=Enterovibrio qingdaonensis TaxID=2899818 RepID=A0ABT5QIX9_9GAMM|nr:aminotransferase class I/II-fold pyridoxal phosphate-dependent enzyme [Enterovibrio sp. ZSDZ35]MDD1780939.1 aminotransferase class I/II-fold pyridoxal phosphate-dependent enzyme [Enterovibrio sp. ZSDZ35]